MTTLVSACQGALLQEKSIRDSRAVTTACPAYTKMLNRTHPVIRAIGVSHTVQVAIMSFNEIFDLTAGVYYIRSINNIFPLQIRAMSS